MRPQGDGGRGVGKTPNYVTCAAPEFRYKVPGGVKATATYTELVKSWRAGLIADFYYGTRSDTDSTLIWQIDGREVDRDAIAPTLAGLASAAGVVSIEWGDFWCGYRALVVRFVDGSSVTQQYDGMAVVERVERAA